MKRQEPPDVDGAILRYAAADPEEQARILDGISFALRPGEVEYHRRRIAGEAGPGIEPANRPGADYEVWVWVVHNPAHFGDLRRVA